MQPAAGDGSAKRGLTLIEVVLATAILSVSLVVLLTGASRCVAVLKRARQHQDIQWTLNIGELEHPLLESEDIEDQEVDLVEYPRGYSFARVIMDDMTRLVPEGNRLVEEDDDTLEDGLYIVRSQVFETGREEKPVEEVMRYVLQLEKK